MKLEELVAKLAQIEEQAALTVGEYPGGLTLERQRLIIGIARQVRAHLEDQLKRGARVAVIQDAGQLSAVNDASINGAN